MPHIRLLHSETHRIKRVGYWLGMVCVMYLYGRKEEVYSSSALVCFIGPFALCLPERTAVQLKDGAETS